jgi:ATP-dependent RNA helicase DDX46/PRP5
LDPNEKRKVDKKSLKNIDTTPIEYEAIRKNLYIESREISLMTEKEVAEYRKKNGDIKVRGIQCPKPIKSWYQCGLPNTVLEQLERKKFETPFPI